MAAPRAPAVSPLGMMWIGMSACSSRWAGMPARISSMNHCWNSLPVSMRAAADDQGVGVEGVDHFVEEEAERVRLDAEDLAAHRVAALGHAAHQFGGLVQIAILPSS